MKHFLHYIEDAIRNNWDKPAISNYGAKTYTFGEIASNGAFLPDGTTAGTEKIVRGGNYTSKPGYCRSAERYSYNPAAHKHEAGFRLCSTYWFQEEQLLDPVAQP